MADNEDVQNKVTNGFKTNVKKWLSIDDEIRHIRSKIKDLNTEKKQYEENILGYLEEVGEKEFKVHDGTIRKNTYKSKAPLSKESIQKALAEIVEDKTKVPTMTDHIINSRKLVERVSLKRTKNRSNK